MTRAASPRLDHAAIERVRARRGRSILLFLTDRCPVGCAHCSVDSRGNSPTIADFDLFGRILDWIAREDAFDVVAFSGGEPFVERRGLTLACDRLAAAGKRIVLFTSGVWARQARTPAWTRRVLEQSTTVYLSTDAFHMSHVTGDDFVRAARQVATSGAWLVVQGLDDATTRRRIEELLARAFGPEWPARAEVNLNAPLANGRGAALFFPPAHTPGADFGPCTLVRNPMVRYDGTVVGCCNEDVLMGRGPARLRRRAETAQGFAEAARAFHDDPLLRVIGDSGFGALTRHPRLNDLGDACFANNCDLCWKALDRMEGRGPPDRLMSAMAALGQETPQ